MQPLLILHDRVTRAGYFLACLCLFIIVVITNFEIFMRYAVNAPTRWSGDLSTYLLLVSIAFGMPEITRTGGNVAITILSEKLRPTAQRIVQQMRYVSCVAAILVLTYLILVTAAQEFMRGILTVAAFPIPKWLLNAALAYGFLSSGVYFARAIFIDAERKDT